AFSSNGRYLAAGTDSGPIVVWDLAQGRVRELIGHGAQVFGVAFDAAGQLLASASDDTTVRLWDVGRGEERMVLRGHERYATRVVFAPTGELFSAGRDGTVRQWDVKTGAGTTVVSGQQSIYGLAVDSGGKWIVTGSFDGAIRLWSVESRKELALLRGHQDVVTATVLSPDGRHVVSSSADGSVRLWNVDTGTSTVVGNHRGTVSSVVFSSDGRWVTSSSHDATVRLWSVEVGVVVGEARERGHSGGVSALDFAPDGKTIVSSGDDKTIRAWDTMSGRQRTLLTGHHGTVTAVAVHPSGHIAASASHDRSVRIWDLATGSSEELTPRHGAQVWDLGFGLDGRMLASADANGHILLWDVQTRSQSGKLRARTSIVGTVIAPNGDTIAGAGVDGSVFVWDRASLRLTTELRGHEGPVWSVAFVSDGGTLVSSGYDGTVRRWDVASGHSRILVNQGGRVWRIAASPDGRLLGIPGSDGVARIYALASGDIEGALRGHRHDVAAFRFSPDGKLAATGGQDGTVRTWDVATGRPYWRAPLLLRSPPRILTHRGWDWLDRGKAITTSIVLADMEAKGSSADGIPGRGDMRGVSPSWLRIVAEKARLAVQVAGGESTGESIGERSRVSEGSPAGYRASANPASDRKADGSPAASGGDLLCLLTYDDEIQLWSMSADRLLASAAMREMTGHALSPRPSEIAAPAERAQTASSAESAIAKLAATRNSCLVLADSRVFLLEHRDDDRHEARASVRELASKASVVAYQAGRILIAGDGSVVVLDGENRSQMARMPVEQGVSALALAGDGRLLVVGYDTGDIELLPIGAVNPVDPANPVDPVDPVVPVEAVAARPGISFEETLPFAVERISEGPRQTLVVGYASGDLGIWSLETGKRLRHFKLHGPIVHLLVDSATRQLYAATEVGDYRAIDLITLYQDYCALLDDIWSNVPVVWQTGVPAQALPPAKHRCRLAASFRSE
ncbi:MAG: WD40 repeat domain-containing protein, partial [Pseudomonadota bacterium]